MNFSIFSVSFRVKAIHIDAAPQRMRNDKFLKEIESAVDKKNLVIVNVTQCIKGTVTMKHYNAGAKLLNRGVISGADMTPEAALIKMMFC